MRAILALMLLVALSTAAATPPPTLRIDWQHGGDAQTEH